MGSNPNAAVAGLSGAVSVLAVWIAGLFNVDMGAEVGAAISTIIVGAVLFLGKPQKEYPVKPGRGERPAKR